MKPRILVVDDDEDHRFITVNSLRRAEKGRYQVEQAASGKEALALLATFVRDDVPVLVLSDYRMPNMNGVTLAETIEVTHPGAAVKFVLFTSMDSIPKNQQSFRHDLEVLVKPLHLAEYRRILARVVEAWLVAP